MMTDTRAMASWTGHRVLVTGGAGFIGSALVEELLRQGNEVTVLDNFSTGRLENLLPFGGDRRLRLLVGDIRDRQACLRAMEGAELVFHEAALGSVPRSVREPSESVAVNVCGFVNVLQSAVELGVGRVVYASSSSVYGDHPGLPKVEPETGRARSPYAITKVADEMFAANFHELYGLDTVGLRYFNVFGRRQDERSAYAAVIPQFVSRLLRHERPVIHGDGSHSRDFTHVDNVVQANLLAATVTAPEALNEAYNVACGGRTTLNELFEELREALSAHDPAVRGIVPEHDGERPGDVAHSQASIEKARRLLGYEPVRGFAEGIRETVGWYVAHASDAATSAGQAD